MNTDQVLFNFRDITIRGRFAYAYICIDKNLPLSLKNSEVFIKYWHQFKRFPNENDLGEFEEQIREFTPYFVLNSELAGGARSLHYISPPEFFSLKELYQGTQPIFLQLINNLYFISWQNLFGGTGAYSPITLEYLNDIIVMMERNGLHLEPIDSFRRFQIENGSVWGNNKLKYYD